tara:strand:+ start:1275 stop:2057 length:783 start_codon:yes stop_codon:yes gene_type:complete
LQFTRWYTPALYGLLAIIFLQYSGLDAWLASQIYAYNQGWLWQDSWLLEQVLHKGGRTLITVWLIGLLLLTSVSFIFKLLNGTQRFALLYLTCASLISILVISALKQVTLLPCPWDVQGLGGEQAYVYLHQAVSSHLQGRQCFPAGHASGGYALFSLYFAAQIGYSTQGKMPSRYWLLPGLVAGGLFGLAQQFRGAHFLSHDLTTAILCWYSCFGLWLMFNKQLHSQVNSKKPLYLPHGLSLNKAKTSGSGSLSLLEKSQ